MHPSDEDQHWLTHTLLACIRTVVETNNQSMHSLSLNKTENVSGGTCGGISSRHLLGGQTAFDWTVLIGMLVVLVFGFENPPGQAPLYPLSLRTLFPGTVSYMHSFRLNQSWNTPTPALMQRCGFATRHISTVQVYQACDGSGTTQ